MLWRRPPQGSDIFHLRSNLRHSQEFSQKVGPLKYNLAMNTEEQIIKNEIDQYIRTLKAKGMNETQALAFAFASAYTLLTDNQIDDLFALLSKV